MRCMCLQGIQMHVVWSQARMRSSRDLWLGQQFVVCRFVDLAPSSISTLVLMAAAAAAAAAHNRP